jgi:serine/threonine protein kinase
MEFMDKGSLDGIYKKIGAVDIEVVGHVALAVLEGLTYLYDIHRIIHRGMHSISPNIGLISMCLARHQTF